MNDPPDSTQNVLETKQRTVWTSPYTLLCPLAQDPQLCPWMVEISCLTVSARTSMLSASEV